MDARKMISILEKVDSNLWNGIRFEFEDLKREINDTSTRKNVLAKSKYDYFQENWIQALENIKHCILSIHDIYKKPISDEEISSLVFFIEYHLLVARDLISHLFEGQENLRSLITLKNPKSTDHINIDDIKFLIYALNRDGNINEPGNRISDVFSQILGLELSDYAQVVKNKAFQKNAFLEKLEKLLPE